ncbi:MAG: proline--tRNA ligase [Alphaproteobacteria bacterium]|nr:proline--tRNA ligase [Alphaproteobacteria bacterium]
MRRSRYLLPTLRETPKEAEIVSHRLMLRAGMVRQSAAGIYIWLPLGYRVMNKIARIVREEQDRAGSQEFLMPTIQPAELWKRSGRYDGYGPEMLRIQDRQERDLLYGPTNEEVITDLFASSVRSYRDLPKLLYHIQWKFRDELRPRFGVMRGREFLMKDNYSFDVSAEAARHSYNKMFVSYLRTFARLGLRAIPMEADTGPIGGDMSHEFIILARTGESQVWCDRRFLDVDVLSLAVNYDNADEVAALVRRFTKDYARTDEKHDAAKFAADVPEDRRYEGRGIEVGHIFHFGTKYSEPLNARVRLADGGDVAVHMGSYGIGVSRLVGAIIEASHDDRGIIWPESVAPFAVGLLNLKVGDSACDALAERAYAELARAKLDTLYDDRDERAGTKFSDLDLTGLPWRMVVSPRGVARGLVELRRRDSEDAQELSLEEAIEKVRASVADAANVAEAGA